MLSGSHRPSTLLRSSAFTGSVILGHPLPADSCPVIGPSGHSRNSILTTPDYHAARPCDDFPVDVGPGTGPGPTMRWASNITDVSDTSSVRTQVVNPRRPASLSDVNRISGISFSPIRSSGMSSSTSRIPWSSWKRPDSRPDRHSLPRSRKTRRVACRNALRVRMNV